MKHNLVLTLLGALLLTTFSCQKSEIIAEENSNSLLDGKSTAYYEKKGCTYTQGYWKNHCEEWPVDCITLGCKKYSKEELIKIFKEPVRGNGLVSLAHQLIAAKLNIANGACPDDIDWVIYKADKIIDGNEIPPCGDDYIPTSEVSWLVEKLAAFNEGQTGPGHCD